MLAAIVACVLWAGDNNDNEIVPHVRLRATENFLCSVRFEHALAEDLQLRGVRKQGRRETEDERLRRQCLSRLETTLAIHHLALRKQRPPPPPLVVEISLNGTLWLIPDRKDACPGSIVIMVDP